MNGILTIKDEKTQQIISQPVFIPFIFLKADGGQSFANPQIVSNSNLRIDNVDTTVQQGPSGTRNRLSPHRKYIENDHDYCLINNLSCLTNHPLLGSAKTPNRALGLKRIGAATESRISISDSNESDTNEEVIVLDSENSEDHISSELQKEDSPRTVQNCYRCEKDVPSDLFNSHLAQHLIEEQQKFELKIEKARKMEEKRQASRTCGTCSEIFESKKELQDHFQIHPPFVCENCGRTFIKKDSFNAHKVTHNDPNSFICEACGRGFKDPGSLRVHLRIHESNVVVKCNLCSKTFNNKNKLAYHTKKAHREPLRYQCSYCGKVFTNQSGHNLHVKIIHLKEKPYECNICHKKFGRKDYLKNHKYSHTNEPRPKRDQPGKAPTSRERWLKWINRPIKENGEPIPCKFCGKPFQTVAGMKRHLLSHVKRYSCQFCPLTFSAKARKQRHEKIHEEGEFFRCNVCWKRFESKEMLDEHSICHTNARYTCEMCGEMFNRRYLMNHHRLMNHIDTSDKDKLQKILNDSLWEATENQSVN